MFNEALLGFSLCTQTDRAYNNTAMAYILINEWHITTVWMLMWIIRALIYAASVNTAKHTKVFYSAYMDSALVLYCNSQRNKLTCLNWLVYYYTRNDEPKSETNKMWKKYCFTLLFIKHNGDVGWEDNLPQNHPRFGWKQKFFVGKGFSHSWFLFIRHPLTARESNKWL